MMSIENEIVDLSIQAAEIETGKQHGNAGEVWVRVADNVNRITRNDPERAFNLGLELGWSPPLADLEAGAWLEGVGFQLLSKTVQQERLESFLTLDRKGRAFARQLVEASAFWMREVGEERLMSCPQFFNALAALGLCLEFKGLREYAKDRLGNLFLVEKLLAFGKLEETRGEDCYRMVVASSGGIILHGI